MTGSTAQNYPPRDPQLFYELARDRLNTQLSIIDGLDNKIGLLVSLASGLLGILAAVFALRSAADESTISVYVLLMLGATTVAYGVVAYAGIKAYFCRAWKIGPELRQVWNDLWIPDDDDALTTWKIANALWSDYEANSPAQEEKAKALLIALVGVIIQSCLLVLALALTAAGV